MRTWLMVVGIVLSAPAGAQVPVTDAPANFSLLKGLVQEAKAYAVQGQQLLQETQTTVQLVQTYNSFVQNPSLGTAAGLINMTGLGNDLPINPNGLVGLTSGYGMSLNGLAGKLSQLSSLANASYDQNRVYECTDNSWACAQQRQRAYGLAGTSGMAQAAYQNIRDHMPVVQALRDRAATATTPAERENVSLALQSEQVWHDNLMGQINAAQMQAKVDEGNLAQRDNEKMSQDIDATIAQIPGG